MGIIEPITYAMQMGFLNVPEYMIEIVRWVIGKGNIPLIMRLSTSLDIFREVDNEYIKEARELLKRNNID